MNGFIISKYYNHRVPHYGHGKFMKFGAICIANNPRDGANTFKVGKTERMKELTGETSNLGTYTAKSFFVVENVNLAERRTS
jgi:hypothetical protein